MPSEHKAYLRIMKQHQKWTATSQNQKNYPGLYYITYASIKVCLTSSTSLAPSTLVPHILLPSPSHSVATNFHCCPLHPSNCLFHRQTHTWSPSTHVGPPINYSTGTKSFCGFPSATSCLELSITCVLGPQQCSSWPILGVSRMAVQL